MSGRKGSVLPICGRKKEKAAKGEALCSHRENIGSPEKGGTGKVGPHHPLYGGEGAHHHD